MWTCSSSSPGSSITSLVINEWARDRRCDIRRFWSRRARRLLPATVVLLAALAGFAALDDRTLKYRTLRADTFVSLASVVNWRFADGGEAYFDRFAPPSLLRHLWSLSVEAQFYVLWPLLLVLLLLVPGRWTALVATSALALLSAVAMALLASNTARRDFGTDTHAHGLLLGAAAALLCVARVEVRGRAVAVGGFLGAAAVVVGLCRLQGNDVLAFRGGIFAIGIATVLVVLAVSAEDPRGPSVRALSSPPLRVLGLLSFGIYLWHWPLLHIFDTEPIVVPARPDAAARIRVVPRGRAPGALGMAATEAGRVARRRGNRADGRARRRGLAVPVAAPQACAEAVAASRSAETMAPACDRGRRDTPRIVVVGDSVAETTLPGLVAREATAGACIF